MSYRPTAVVREWLQRRGYLPSDAPDVESWEYVYGHSSGYGTVTLRFWPHAYGWDLIVQSGQGRYQLGVNLGTCTTLAQMQAVDARLREFERQRVLDAQGQRLPMVEPLVEQVKP